MPRFHESWDFVRVCWGVRFNFSGAPDVSLLFGRICDDFWGKFRIQSCNKQIPPIEEDFLEFILDC